MRRVYLSSTASEWVEPLSSLGEPFLEQVVYHGGCAYAAGQQIKVTAAEAKSLRELGVVEFVNDPP